MHRRRFVTGVLFVVAAAGIAVPPRVPSWAATLVVDDSGGTPYQTIQSAINAAVPAQDEVLVRCGTYPENVFMRDLVSVRGQSPFCTIIDGGQAGSVVTMIGISAATSFEKFTVRNGRSDLGGGIYVEGGSPRITQNVIIGNSAPDLGPLTGYGGGIHVTTSIVRLGAAPAITHNVIRGNSAARFGGGIEIYSDAGSLIANNLIVENIAGQGGGGIDVFSSFPTIANNLIVRNCLQSAGTVCQLGGGGISFDSSGVSPVANNVVAWNEAAGGAGGVDLVGSSVNFSSNDAFSNLPVNYAGVADPTGANGNISLDPRFVDQRPHRAGYQPRSDSPLVDAGLNSLAPAMDLRQVPRPVDGNSDGTAVSDIGARENEGATRLTFASSTSLAWDGSINPAAVFNVYRGDLAVLKSTGVYTQDTATVAGARRWCGLASPTVGDTDLPAAGQTLFYLAVIDAAVEGPLGYTSNAVQRPYTNPHRCP